MKATTNFQVFITKLQLPNTMEEILLSNNYITKLLFIENIKNMYITGQIDVLDKEGLFETMKLTGKEGVKILITQKIYSGENKFKEYVKMVEFDILDIEVEDMARKNNIFRFLLIEKGGFDFYGKNFNKGYNNKKVSDIIKDVMINQLKIKEVDFEIEPTLDLIDNFVIPYWKPALTIQNLRKKARRLKNPNEGGFLFFSTMGDTTRKTPIKKFVSMANLLEKPINENQQDVNFIDTYLFKDFSSNPLFINTLKSCRIPSYCKNEVLMDGIGGKHYFGIDYNTDKNIIEEKQIYSDYFKKSITLGKEALLDIDVNSINDDVDIVGGPSFMVRSRQDMSFRFLMENYNDREIIVNGALFRYVGQNILFEQTSDKNSGDKHMLDSGKYIITHITHHYDSSGEYNQKIKITKDSFNKTGITNGKRITK